MHGPEHYLRPAPADLRRRAAGAAGRARALTRWALSAPVATASHRTLALVQLAANEIELRLLDDTPAAPGCLQLRDDDEQDCRLVFADDGRWLAGCGEDAALCRAGRARRRPAF